MTLEEVIAAYRFAGVADPERMAAAFIAIATPPALAVPACPACQAAASEVCWTGGSPPDGADSWRCVQCQHSWITPPIGSKP
jgi:hypothetical protein